MLVIVNGEKVFLSAQLSIAEFLQQQDYRTERIVTELNGRIVCRESYGGIVLKDGDKLEIVSFVGGG